MTNPSNLKTGQIVFVFGRGVRKVYKFIQDKVLLSENKHWVPASRVIPLPKTIDVEAFNNLFIACNADETYFELNFGELEKMLERPGIENLIAVYVALYRKYHSSGQRFGATNLERATKQIQEYVGAIKGIPPENVVVTRNGVLLPPIKESLDKLRRQGVIR